MLQEPTNIQSSFRQLNLQEILAERNMQKKRHMLQYLAQQCRVEVFDMLRNRQNGHWGGSASAAEMLTTLYFHILRIDPGNPRWQKRDRLVLSKGHAAPILYNLLAKRGFFPVDELNNFRCLGSILQGHPSMPKAPGVDMSTGPLGHGLSVGTGMALAARYLRMQYKTFVLMGEGCLNEGQTWEAVMAAAKFQPPNLVIMIDYNKVQLDGSSDEIMPLDPLYEKFRAFNLKVAEKIYDGHLVSDVLDSWEWVQQHNDKPVVVIYKTHKGKGVSFMEDNYIWHGAPIDDESYEKGRPELINKLKELEELL
jgi:transketolase